MTRPQSRIFKINSLKQRISNNRSRHSLVAPLQNRLVNLMCEQLRYENRLGITSAPRQSQSHARPTQRLDQGCKEA
jgi:hypothetical protein